MILQLFTCLLALVVIACSRNDTPQVSDLQAAADKPSQAWIAKAARTLRYRGHLVASDPLEQWASSSKEQVVDALMEDPRFIETVLDFNLYYLGQKTDFIYDISSVPTRHYRGASSFPSAITAARAVASGGDYFTLLAWEQPFYFFRPTDPSAYGGASRSLPPGLSMDGKRAFYLGRARAIIDTLAAQFQPPAPGEAFQSAEACRGVTTAAENIGEEAAYAGFSDSNFSISFFTKASMACFVDKDHVDREQVLTSIQSEYQHLELLEALGRRFSSEHYTIRSPADLIPVSQAEFGEPAPNTAWTSSGLWTNLPNSSTNHNRKRSAYALRTYFCDDLTPLNVAIPAEHTGNIHADDPACQACHFKLDPMAGFFRERGVAGFDFTGKSQMIFDDFARLDGAGYQKYLQSWAAPAGSPRPWNVGYIRTTDPNKANRNFYGDSLPGLHAFLRGPEAPEVRQCLTRRLAEYFVGKDQAFSGAWLDGLSSEFETALRDDPQHSATAFRSVVKKLVLSQTFAASDPEQDHCYDQAPGDNASALPCRIAFVIQKNCAQCHGEGRASHGLELTSWVKLNDGTSSFLHLESDNRQVSKAETLSRILDRLSPVDPRRAMPLGKLMADTERAALYKWVNDQLQKTREAAP